MKEGFFTPFKVGLVFIGSIVAFGLMYTVVNTELDQGDGTYTVSAVFDDVTGLAPKTRVQLAGIRVGEVDNIELVKGTAKAKVTVRLQKRIELYEGMPQPVPGTDRVYFKNGATLARKQASLLGDYYLEITPGLASESNPQLAEGGTIHNVPRAVGLGDIFDKFDVIAADIKKVTRTLAETFGSDEGQQRLTNILKRLEEIATNINDFIKGNKDDLSSIVANARDITGEFKGMTREVRGDVKRVLADANAITREVRYIVGQSGSDFQEGLGTLKNTLARLSVTLEQLNYTLGNVGEITDKINEGEGTIGVLVNDPTIAEETEKAVKGVGDFVDRVVRLKTIVELRSEYLVRQTALKNYVAIRLQPTEDKYYLIELVDDPRGRSNLLQTTTLSTDPNETSVIREDKVITTDSFKFSVMLAKRWDFFTGRFGLIESSGGVGGDLHFLKDTLELKADLFDVGEDVRPRVRAAAAYSFFQYVYVLGGIDDILNDESSDFYFGVMLRFNDEDLKTILSTAPSPSFN
jgi:phospholipid/cholesterol/gamma-HCH transport system substrate-binding protein